MEYCLKLIFYTPEKYKKNSGSEFGRFSSLSLVLRCTGTIEMNSSMGFDAIIKLGEEAKRKREEEQN